MGWVALRYEIFQARVLEWVAIAFSEIPTIYSSFPGGSLVKNLPVFSKGSS